MLDAIYSIENHTVIFVLFSLKKHVKSIQRKVWLTTNNSNDEMYRGQAISCGRVSFFFWSFLPFVVGICSFYFFLLLLLLHSAWHSAELLAQRQRVTTDCANQNRNQSYTFESCVVSHAEPALKTAFGSVDNIILSSVN